jgi:plastocyanin
MRLTSLCAIGALTVSSVYAALSVDKRGRIKLGGYLFSMQYLSTGTTHDVWVGGNAGLVYSPEFVMANAGDVVVFHFGPKNHTVTQSTFAVPCGAMMGGVS